jgi:hypothetical protein
MRARMTKRYEKALNRNDGPVPKAAMRKPETAGPIRRPALKFAEFRLTAFGKSS